MFVLRISEIFFIVLIHVSSQCESESFWGTAQYKRWNQFDVLQSLYISQSCWSVTYHILHGSKQKTQIWQTNKKFNSDNGLNGELSIKCIFPHHDCCLQIARHFKLRMHLQPQWSIVVNWFDFYRNSQERKGKISDFCLFPHNLNPPRFLSKWKNPFSNSNINCFSWIIKISHLWNLWNIQCYNWIK